jgi:molybdopterin/thiamine biosynthesis adenylyltransferase
MIPGFGEGAAGLKSATALIAGLGGLGSPLALYLAAAGVGHLKLVDMDDVELSDLNRQVLHWDEDVGKAKVTSASQRVKKINPTTRVEGFDLARTTKMSSSLPRTATSFSTQWTTLQSGTC